MDLGGSQPARAKNLRDLRLEKEGHVLLLRDARFQRLDRPCKRRILDLLGVDANERYGPQSFDLVMTDVPVEPITIENVSRYLDGLALVELKTTKKPIRNAQLGGFFYGATENEYRLAQLLGRRFVFAFVVINEVNEYGSPFAVLRTLEEIEAQTQSRRTQFQVSLRAAEDQPDPGDLVLLEVLGEATNSPS
ncbi:MAG: hypothetical protein RL338_1223 [Chloroflexota bacterium]